MQKSLQKIWHLFMIRNPSKLGKERNYAIYQKDKPKVNFIICNDEMLRTFLLRLGARTTII